MATLSTMLLPETGATSVSAAVVAVLSAAIMGWFSGTIAGVTAGVSLSTPWGSGEMRVPVGWEE